MDVMWHPRMLEAGVRVQTAREGLETLTAQAKAPRKELFAAEQEHVDRMLWEHEYNVRGVAGLTQAATWVVASAVTVALSPPGMAVVYEIAITAALAGIRRLGEAGWNRWVAPAQVEQTLRARLASEIENTQTALQRALRQQARVRDQLAAVPAPRAAVVDETEDHVQLGEVSIRIKD